MSEFRLVCNFKQCRQTLYVSAYVTTCSHIFCTHHGLVEIFPHIKIICPVCGKHLKAAQDIVRVNLDPNETNKSVMLAGLRPELIIDIAARGLKFWGYQTDSAILYTEGALKALVENLLLQRDNSETHAECNKVADSFKQKIQTLNEELNLSKTRYAVLLKQYQKKTEKYNKLKLKVKNDLEPKSSNNHGQNSHVHFVYFKCKKQVPQSLNFPKMKRNDSLNH